MELHLVHFKTEYGNDIGSAIANEPEKRDGKNDNLAVLGIMFEIQDEDNEGIFLSWQNIFLTLNGNFSYHLLKYGFCKKSLWKDATLTS